MPIVYKVFARRGDNRLMSCLIRGEYCLAYPKGKITCPKVGRLYAFKTFQDAWYYANPSEEVWECECGKIYEVRPDSPYAYWFFGETDPKKQKGVDIADWWKHKPILSSWKADRYTGGIHCDWIKPIRRVYNEYH